MAENKGHKNLVPQNRRTKDEQRRIAAEGGRASGAARRKRKAFKDLMEIVLECEPDPKTMNAMLRKGIGDEDLTMATAITIALAKEAAKGNVAAFKELRDLVGELDASHTTGPTREAMAELTTEELKALASEYSKQNSN